MHIPLSRRQTQCSYFYRCALTEDIEYILLTTASTHAEQKGSSSIGHASHIYIIHQATFLKNKTAFNYRRFPGNPSTQVTLIQSFSNCVCNLTETCIVWGVSHFIYLFYMTKLLNQ